MIRKSKLAIIAAVFDLVTFLMVLTMTLRLKFAWRDMDQAYKNVYEKLQIGGDTKHILAANDQYINFTRDSSGGLLVAIISLSCVIAANAIIMFLLYRQSGKAPKP